MGIFRCQNEECSTDPAGRLIYDFESEVPVCPKCRMDMRSSEGKNLIVRLETIHLHVADKSGPDIGKGKRFKIACTGGSMFGKRATASADAVTCPACKSTPEWNALADEFGGVRHDFDVEVDLEKMVVTRKEGD